MQGQQQARKVGEIPGIGCLVQVTTQQGDNVAEAMSFVPGVKIVLDTPFGSGRRLEKIEA
jgi:hypothetical protein